MTPRNPTPEEIRETNPNMTQTCDKCSLVMYANEHFATFDNSLTITMSGGYGEYVDSIVLKEKECEFTLCHKCAHKLMKFFGQWDFSHWHPRTVDKYCDGWRYQDIPPFDKYVKYLEHLEKESDNA